MLPLALPTLLALPVALPALPALPVPSVVPVVPVRLVLSVDRHDVLALPYFAIDESKRLRSLLTYVQSMTTVETTTADDAREQKDKCETDGVVCQQVSASCRTDDYYDGGSDRIVLDDAA